MSRINTNVTSLVAQRVLGLNNQSLNTALERLSTGLRINRGKDDPAGLIASENLRSDIKATNTAIANAERAERVVNIAEGGLQEISSLLTELQGLVTATANTAGLSTEEKTANQQQIDSILQTVDRIASSSNFQGIKLLNGNFDFQVSGQAAGVSDLRINGAKFDGASLDVTVLVTQSAQQAGVYLSTGSGSLDLTDSDSAFTVEVSGLLGSREFTFASGTTLDQVAATINTFSDVTGVQATVSAGEGIKLVSDEFGSSAFVSVKILSDGGQAGGIRTLASDDFSIASGSATNFSDAAAETGIRDNGQNVGVTINGIAATTNGKTARINTDFLDVQLTLSTAEAQAPGAVEASSGEPAFYITGGGADFQLAATVDISGKVSLGVAEVAARKLGSDAAGGFLDDLGAGKALNLVDGDLNAAQEVVSDAIAQVSAIRGRLGAFQKNTIGATIRSLNVAVENTTAAESTIRDADFALETASLTRSQILVSASTNVLALANQQPQTALQLLG